MRHVMSQMCSMIPSKSQHYNQSKSEILCDSAGLSDYHEFQARMLNMARLD